MSTATAKRPKRIRKDTLTYKVLRAFHDVEAWGLTAGYVHFGLKSSHTREEIDTEIAGLVESGHLHETDRERRWPRNAGGELEPVFCCTTKGHQPFRKTTPRRKPS